MQPCYYDGDYILVMRYGQRRPRQGDDVLLQHRDFGTVLKRIESIKNGRLRLQGLNRLSADAAALGTVNMKDCRGLRRVAMRIARR